MNERIVFDPLVQQGKPVIKGTRLPVATILGSLAGGMSAAQIAQEYAIELADIEAALSYAAEVIESERAIALT
jgi:uncharacterized protein (DUF433 family)